MFQDTAIKMKRIKELVVWTTDKPWEQLPIGSGDTHYEILPGHDSIKTVSKHHIGSDREPGGKMVEIEGSVRCEYLGYGQPYSWAGLI